MLSADEEAMLAKVEDRPYPQVRSPGDEKDEADKKADGKDAKDAKKADKKDECGGIPKRSKFYGHVQLPSKKKLKKLAAEGSIQRKNEMEAMERALMWHFNRGKEEGPAGKEKEDPAAFVAEVAEVAEPGKAEADDAAEKRCEELQGIVDSDQKRIALLEKALREKDRKIEDLQGRCDGKDKAFRNLEKDLEDERQKSRKNQVELGKMRKNLMGISSTANNAGSAESDALRAELRKKDDRIEQLDAEIEEYKTRISEAESVAADGDLKAENEMLDAKVKELEGQLRTANVRIFNMENGIVPKKVTAFLSEPNVIECEDIADGRYNVCASYDGRILSAIPSPDGRIECSGGRLCMSDLQVFHPFREKEELSVTVDGGKFTFRFAASA